MERYLHLFETDNDRITYEEGDDYIEPYVSLVESDNGTHYNIEPKIVAKFNVTSTTEPTKILNKASSFTSVEIDGVEQQNVVSGYTFDTIGEHTIKYVLKDRTSLENSFYKCSDLISITIGNGVTSIDQYAFQSCTNLSSVTIGNGVTSIGQYAFEYCSGLTSVTIPDSVTSIGDGTFTSCYKLTSIDIPDSVISIGQYAFNYCSGLTSINISSGVTSIGNSAFTNCISILSVEIPSSITSISNYLFKGCSSLTSLTIPSSITSVGTYAFSGCTSLSTITSLATTAPTIQSNTFQNVKTGGTLYVPSGSNYTKWMGTGNYYLGKYSWTKVEQ